MCDFKRGRDLDQLAMGCDRDIWDSSTSTVHMDYSEAEDAARFHGHIAAGGYAAWRTQRPLGHMFGVPSFNLSQLSHLQLRYGGESMAATYTVAQDSKAPGSASTLSTSRPIVTCPPTFTSTASS